MSNPPAATAELVVLDVGHGNAAIVHENSTNLLIDAAIGSHVLEYLKQRAISTLNLVVLSHSDQDHIGGLIAILNAGIHVKSVRLNADSEKATETWRDLIFSLEDARRNGNLEFSVGLSSGPLLVSGFVLCSSEIVAPTPGLAALGAGAQDRKKRKITSNSISACIRLLYDKQPVATLAGDMDEVSLDDAIDAHSNLAAPVLIFPHHGGLPGAGDPTNFTNKLLAAVKPTAVIFSIGRAKHDTPRPEIVNAIKRFDPKMHVACTQMSTHCAETLSTTPQLHLSPLYSSGAAKNKCCAGSLVINLRSAGLATDFQAAHEAFVKKAATSPLCLSDMWSASK